MRKLSKVLPAGIFALAAVSVSDASAQTSQESENKEIVVTAQGRTQVLQNVPIAIDAVSGAALQEQSISNLETLAPKLASVKLSESPFTRSIAIRGLGSTGGNIGYEQSAPLFVDGVFAGRGGQFQMPFFDLERVEIVKGPQAIFFGKNATAGAISILSARPTDTFYASINAGYEVENKGYTTEAVVSGPLAANVRGRISVLQSKGGDYLRDVSAGKDVGGREDTAVRLGLDWQATPNLNFYLKGEYSEREADRRNQLVCANSAVTAVAIPGQGPVECVQDNRITSGDAFGPFQAAFPPGSDYEDGDARNVALVTNWDVGAHTVQFTTGYSAFTSQNQDGLDRSSLGLAVSSTGERFNQYSQEIRLISPTGGRFEYVLGGLYLRAVHKVDQTLAQAVPVFVGDLIQVNQKSEAYSAFGRLTWNIKDNLRLSAGARYTDETKDYTSSVGRVLNPVIASAMSINNRPTTFNAIYLQDLSRSETSFDPSITLEADVSDDILVYATAAQGTKAGGFDFFPRASVMPVNGANLEYGDERARNYELGFKADFNNRRSRLNGSFFYSDLSGLQNQVVNIAILGFQTFNAKDAHTAGVELEGYTRITDELKLGGAVSYLDAEYDEFKTSTVNYTGNRLPFAPEWSGNVYLDGDFSLGNDLALAARVQANYSDPIAFDASNDPADNAKSYTTVDARLALVSDPAKWEVAVSARNLFDKEIRLFSNPTILSVFLPSANPRGVVLSEGRTVFLTFKKEF